MKNISKIGFCLILIYANQSFGATVSGVGGAFTPPGTTSGVVTFTSNAASEPGTVIPGGTVPDVNVPAVLGYNTQITNISLLNAQHTFAADLDLRLISPNGVIYTFNLDNGGSTGLDVASDMLFYSTASDCADQWTSSTSAAQPENDLLFETIENTCGPIDTSFDFVCNAGVGEIDGDEVNGVWTFEVTDDAGGDTGSFDSFSITLAGMTPPVVDSSGVSIDPASCMTVPDAPILGAVTAGDSSFSVAFAPPANDGGAAIIDYAVTCDSVPSVVGAGSPISVGGLTNGVTYVNCAVTARNSVGSSLPSATFSVMPIGNQTITNFTATPANGTLGGSSALSATASSGLPVSFASTTVGVCSVSGSTVNYSAIGLCTVTADQVGSAGFNPAPQETLDIMVGADVPGAPIIDDIVADFGMLTVFFSAPASDGGAPITNYIVMCNGFSASGPTSPIAVTGLPNGVNYNCTVAAENSAGVGPASAAVAAGLPAIQVPTLSNWSILLLVMGLVLGTLYYSKRVTSR